MTLVFLAALAAVATGFVLQPIFGDFRAGPDAERPTDRNALRLAERRQQLLLAIAELDFERDAGKIGAEEHRSSRAALLAEAAAVTERLDAVGAPAGRSRVSEEQPAEPKAPPPPEESAG